jgi:type I restriction enzyme R subunit
VAKFGGWIHKYTINDAVEDGMVVPLVYEGRHHELNVNEPPIDRYFDCIASTLSDEGKKELKRKFSRLGIVHKSEQVLSEHFSKNFKGTPFKGLLVAPGKETAIRYHQIMREIGMITTEVLISPPEMREGVEDVHEEVTGPVQQFWKAMMDRFGNSPERYETTLKNQFKKQANPEILIVVDKLLTGFNAPSCIVLYLTRELKDHTLMQAIARVNRLYEDKEEGYIIDYAGNPENLDSALNLYSGEVDFDEEDL